MVDVVLFHHVQGLTDGVLDFAERLRAGGYAVVTPDLFDGHRLGSVDEGFAYVDSTGDDEMRARTERALAELPADPVIAGISWGVATAQVAAQTRPGVRGALFYEAFLPVTGEWAAGPWPDGLPVQIHGMEKDPFFGLEGDLDAARGLVDSVGPRLAELYVYPGDRHLFTDSSLPSYDPDATTLVVQRSLEFLDRLS